MPGNPKFYPFIKSKGRQRDQNQQKVVRIYQHANLQEIPFMRFPENTRKTSPDGRMDNRSRQVGPADPYTGEKSVFRASDGRAECNPKT